jgi:hypothetical protein
VNRILALALASSLAGCGAFDRKVEYVPYETKVPVAVPCAAQVPAEPAWATSTLRKVDTLDDKAKALLGELEQRKGYEEKLKATTAGCR